MVKEKKKEKIMSDFQKKPLGYCVCLCVCAVFFVGGFVSSVCVCECVVGTV